jgi:shikimate kinase
MIKLMLLYLIGPSGVGKTSCGRHAAFVFPRVRFESLDDLCKGQEFDWIACRRALDGLEAATAPGLTVIIDIGAGTQTRPELVQYLAARAENTILLHAPPEEVIRRNPLGPSRDIWEFRQTEYASRRLLYRVAGHVVDVTGLTIGSARQKFIESLSSNFPLLS